jgi:CspA family cold shock protein
MVNYDNAGFRSGSGSQRATVKWFNATKGFGFVTLEDGSDAFCHASALSGLPSPDLPQGATVYCDVAQGQRGMQVTTVHSVDLSTAEAQPLSRGPRPPRGGGYGRESGGPMGGGHVKFFNEKK